ncbi:hypothetical protein B4113_1487 [Geobacillus sp. B4113_201601]|nr:hypothetical protein B4113_1487 [Geobacillus sp. B4113_201601]
MVGKFRKRMCVGFAAEALGANYRRFSLTGANSAFVRKVAVLFWGKGGWQG